jgi:hypothetical protein
MRHNIMGFCWLLLSVVLVVSGWSGIAQADMGPSCGCEVGEHTHVGRGVLATALGLGGIALLLLERTRRQRSTRGR